MSSSTYTEILSSTRDSSAQDVLSKPDPSEIDWYGNTVLHQIFARMPLDTAQLYTQLDSVLKQQPQLARLQNQFGRLPLHYALDRSRVHEAGVRLLVAAYPEAVAVCDTQGHSPYTIAVRWQHSRSILKLLLEACPEVDPDALLRLKYGPLGSLAVWASGLTSSAAEKDDGEVEYMDESQCDRPRSDSLVENEETGVLSTPRSFADAAHQQRDNSLKYASPEAESCHEDRVRLFSSEE
jgi:hypothetical protein